jgi:hypothetical protein
MVASFAISGLHPSSRNSDSFSFLAVMESTLVLLQHVFGR